jgi:hypothetical protein
MKLKRERERERVRISRKIRERERENDSYRKKGVVVFHTHTFELRSLPLSFFMKKRMLAN